jgi:hypothetical protein
MSDRVVYHQLNKDYAYWTEKRSIGQQKGGQVAGLLSQLQQGQVKQNVLFDTGLGTLEAVADFCPDSFWDEPLVIFITHGHIDHHAELMILSEIYCQRRGQDIHDIRPPLQVYCTGDTYNHLSRTHWYGYHGGNTLQHALISPEKPIHVGPFKITPLAVDHFEGAVIFTIEVTLEKPHKIVVGWDMTTLPLDKIESLQQPSLALLEATTWGPVEGMNDHSCLEDLVKTGFLDRLRLDYQPEQELYGAYLVHYSGLEDPWGMLTDGQLKEKFDDTFPRLSNVVRVAGRGQQWQFS